MANCENCGAELTGAGKYCSQCGRPVGEDGQDSSNSFGMMLIGAVVGAFIALIAGFILSLVVTKIALATVGRGTPELAVLFNRLAPRLAGLEYLTAHHVTLSGVGRGGVSLSLLLPVQSFILIPISALLLGGWISSRIGRPRTMVEIFTASLVSACAYVGLLLYLRQWFAVDASVINRIPFGGNVTAFPQVILAGSIMSIFLDAGLLALLIFFLGNLGGTAASPMRSVKAFLTGRGDIMPWASGGLLAIILGQAVILLNLVLTSAAGILKLPAALIVLFAPSMAGWGYYLSHGITITNTRTSSFGDSSAVQLTKISLFEGVKELSKFPGQPWTVTGGRSLPPYLWGLLIIPAAAVLIAAYIAYRNRDVNDSPLVFSFKMAACYAFLLFVLANLYTFRMTSVDAAPGFAGLSRVDMSVVPEFVPVLIFGLVIGFIFSLAGSYLSLRRTSRQTGQQASREEGE